MSARTRNEAGLRSRPLQDLERHGQRVWLGYFRRQLADGGRLGTLVEEAAVSGVVFDADVYRHALVSGSEYRDVLDRLRRANEDRREVLEELLLEDVAFVDAAFARVERARNRAFIAMDAPAHLQDSADELVSWAGRLRDAAPSSTVLIKLVGSSAGVRMAESLLAGGHSVYVGHLFGLEQLRRVLDTYARGLGLCRAAGNDLAGARLVAAFNLVRLDVAVDELLRDRLRQEAVDRDLAESLHGRTAIALGKVARQRLEEFLAGAAWAELADRGAHRPWLAWEGTRTLSAARRDVEYLEELIGPETVAVVSRLALSAFRDHGHARATLDQQRQEAREILGDLMQVGIDPDALADDLQEAAVLHRAQSLEELSLTVGESASVDADYAPGALTERWQELIRRARGDDVVRRLWERDPTLYSRGVEDPAAIRDRLGWLSLPESMAEEALPLLGHGADGGGAGNVVLLGMGGSSLGAEACRVAFGRRDFIVLDTVVPRGVASVAARVDDGALFLVSSKSGTTIETQALCDYFYARIVEDEGEEAGRRFVAITDPGTPLHETARHRAFQRVWLNPPDVGGRYSVLSYYGLVPMALMGVDIGRVLDAAGRMAVACGPEVGDGNPGLRLGAFLAAALDEGRNKLTLLTSNRLAGLADWIEQLVAESSGKGGRGLVPVSQEPLGDADTYGEDRVFVQVRLGDEAPPEPETALLQALQERGAPVVRIAVADPHDLGQEFLRWELAVAIAGALVDFNPFDEPNVRGAKERTRDVLESGTGRVGKPVAEGSGITVVADADADPELAAGVSGSSDVVDWLRAHLCRAAEPDYVCLQAFLAPEISVWHALQGVRALLRDRLAVATTVGWGPRYLHSTGQLHKGGDDRGVFLQLTTETDSDLPIPDRPYTFGELAAAQADADFSALRQLGRRVMRVHLGSESEAGLAELVEVIRAALESRPGGAGGEGDG